MIMKLSVTNEKIKGYIKIDKVSEEDNEYSGLKANSGLAGAEFEICDTEGNFITKVKTNENGEAITEQLLKGVYVIKELKAPDYYLPKDKVYFAEISTNGQISTIEITNQNVELDVSIEKNGYVETQDKDNIYYEFKNIANNSNVAVDNFTWSDELPTKALRLNQLYTGTWNEELEYGVWYKTNLKDEFVLYKDKLSTLVNNKIDFTTIKLADNEYVTDFEMRFGTVKAGFKQEEAPRVYCKMLDKLGNGFLFTNRTKVTATYINETLEARDVWNTVTYYKEIKINEELPKTGL